MSSLTKSSTLLRRKSASSAVLGVVIGGAPVLGAGAHLGLRHGWSAGAQLDLSWSALRRDESGAIVALGTLTTISFLVSLERGIAPGLRAGAQVGGVRYLPSRDTGVFRRGSGGLHPIVGGRVRFAPPAARGFALELRYDLHRFITQALRDDGFAEPRVVHRVALLVDRQW